MASVLPPLTGAQLTLTIGGVARSAITKSAVLTPQETRTTTHYIGGTISNYQNSIEFTLDCTFSSDISKDVATGLHEALWNASSTAPNTALAFVLTDNEVTYTGTLMPMRPPVGGEATAEQEYTLSFPVVTVTANYGA